MGGTITRGTTFTLGQQEVDVATFIVVLTNATIQDVDRDNIALSQGTPATQSASAPDNPQPSEVWQDELTHALKVFVSITNPPASYWTSALSQGKNYTLSDFGTVATVSGDLLRPSTGVSDFTLTQTGSASDFATYAVATDPVEEGGIGVMMRGGPVKVRSTGTINAGEAVRPSATVGVCESAGAALSGYGPTVFGVAISAASGGYVWISLRR